MAAVTFGNTTANVPEVWYIGNEMRLECSSTSPTVTLTVNGYSEKRTVSGGGCTFSLKPFALAGFDTDKLNQLGDVVASNIYESNAVRVLNITLTDNAGTATEKVPCIWGSFDPVDALYQKRELWLGCDDPDYFVTTLRLVTVGGASTIVVSVDGGASTPLSRSSDEAGYDYLLGAFGSFSDWQQVDVTISEVLPNINQQEKTVTVDTTLHILNSASCRGTVMPVRWLDAEGRLHCRSLLVHERQQNVATDSSYTIPSEFDNNVAEDGKSTWFRGNGAYRSGVQVQHLVTLAAPSEDKRLIPELMTLAASEFVSVLVIDDKQQIWRRANVVDSQLTETNKHLQDFAVQLQVYNLKTLLR